MSGYLQPTVVDTFTGTDHRSYRIMHGPGGYWLERQRGEKWDRQGPVNGRLVNRILHLRALAEAS